MAIEITTSKMEKPKTPMNINLRLPSNILEVIFSKLPIVNFPTCRVVCNYWNDLILNYSSSSSKLSPHTLVLCKRDYQMYCIDFNQKSGEISFVASLSYQDYLSPWSSIKCSCNGLLLIYTPELKLGSVDLLNLLANKKYYLDILNPMTNEYFRLPNDDYKDNQDSPHFYGFGLSPKTKLYKVVKVFRRYSKKCIFEIFTIGGSNNQQRLVKHVPFYVHENGVYLNGALYWIGQRIKEDLMIEYVIFRFDLESERIESIISFPLTIDHFIEDTYLEAFNDSLYVTCLLTKPCYMIEVWRMQNCEIEDSWVREFVIKDDAPIRWYIPHDYNYFKFVKCYEDGQILYLISSRFSILYNPRYGNIKLLNQFDPTLLDSTGFSFLWPNTLDSVFRFDLDSFSFGSLQKILVGDDG